MKITLKDPVLSLKARTNPAVRAHAATLGKSRKTAKGPTGHRNNPFGIGGATKGVVRNVAGKGGFKKNDPASRLRILKSAMIRSKRLDASTSKTRKRVEAAKTVAMEARECQEMAKKSMPAVFKRLQKIVEDPTTQDHHAIAAGIFFADRAYGKAIQPNLNTNVNENGNASEISDAELNKRINETLERVAAITSGKTKPPKGKK